MNSEQSTQHRSDAPATLGIVAIACDNSVAHGYIDTGEVLRSTTFLTGAGVEFFDSDGYRLAPVFDGTWRFVGLARTADEPAPEEVQRRLCTMIRNANVTIRQHPESFVASSNAGSRSSHADTEVVLPELDGLDLTVSLQAYASILGHVEKEDDRDRRGPMHNVLHRLGKSH